MKGKSKEGERFYKKKESRNESLHTLKKMKKERKMFAGRDVCVDQERSKEVKEDELHHIRRRIQKKKTIRGEANSTEGQKKGKWGEFVLLKRGIKKLPLW